MSAADQSRAGGRVRLPVSIGIQLDPAQTAAAGLAVPTREDLPHRVGSNVDPRVADRVRAQVAATRATVSAFVAGRGPLVKFGEHWRGSATPVPREDGTQDFVVMVRVPAADLLAAQAHAELLGLTPGLPDLFDWRLIRVASADSLWATHAVYCGAPTADGGWCNLRVSHEGENRHEQRPVGRVL